MQPAPKLADYDSAIFSKEAFSALYDETHLSVFRYIYGLTGGPRQDVQDLTAETFLKAWNARSRYIGAREDGLGWLFTIAKRLVIDRWRREKLHPQQLDIETTIVVAEDASPEEQAALLEESRVAAKMLYGLSQEHRELIVLRYLLGWSVNQIAAHLEMKPNTVSVTIKRILKRMRDTWQLDEENSRP